MRVDIDLVFPNSPFLINPSVFPPLGILYLSAFLKDGGFRVHCFDMGIGHKREDVKAPIVGISFTTPQRFEAFELAKYFKEKGKTLVAGGPHPTHMKQECLDNGFDYVIPGYGEAALASLFGARYFNLPIDLYPYPDRDALPIHEYTYKIDGVPATPIMTSRGCYSNCSFCARISRQFRMQSANRTVSEILHVHEKYGFNAFMIYDDVFVAKKSRLEEISKRLSPMHFKFRCFARAELLTEDVCSCLKRMGMVEVGLGVESGSVSVLRRNMKGNTPETNEQAVRNLRKFGIRAKAFMIVGLPGETHGTILSTVRWLQRVRPDDVDFTVFQPLPGSPIFKNPEKWGVKFEYDGKPGWYKGKPGEYDADVETEELSSGEIVRYRNELEEEFKDKRLLC